MTAVWLLGLGANLGDRRAGLEAALAALTAGGATVTACSPWYETDPWGLADQPAFLNLVVRAETGLGAHALLALAKRIERDLGRDPAAVRYGPRVVDVDLLAVESGAPPTVDDAPTLVVPHPRLAERRFVLAPLLDLAPAYVLPDGRRADDLLAALAPRPAARRVADS